MNDASRPIGASALGPYDFAALQHAIRLSQMEDKVMLDQLVFLYQVMFLVGVPGSALTTAGGGLGWGLGFGTVVALVGLFFALRIRRTTHSA